MRILTLGLSNSGKSAIINRLKFNETSETQPTAGFNVTSVDFNGNRFTLWEVGGEEENRKQFGQHTQNTVGIIYVLDISDQEKFEESKQFLHQAVQDEQLGGVPLLVYANKIDLGGNLQDVIEFLQLNSINDRDWFIQGSEAVSGLGVNQGFDWITKQVLSKGNKSFSFEAQPKVVKSHTKYRQQDQQPTSKSQMTFMNLMKEQKFIMMNPVQQENEYIKLEKERLKIENMHQQLKSFKKNKNKMTPYEIKPSPNPRIDVNLEFFLTDHNNLIVPQKNDCPIQTDEFQERPPSPPYIPKKTGIDAATQVEDFELFDFDREVTPIVDVIVSKTCEQSMLEIEQEEELQKMKQFKREYYERREQDKEKQQQILNREIDEIKNKNDKLNKYLDQEDRKITALQRAQSFGIAGCYLKNVQQNVFSHLYKNGYYPNNMQIQLKTEFVPWLVKETMKELQKDVELTNKMEGLFDSHCIPPILEVQKPIIEERKKKKARIEQRRINEQNEKRIVRIFYKESKFQQSNFVRDFAKFSDGSLEEYRKSYEAKVEDLKSKVEAGEIQEEDYNKLLLEEFPEQTGWGFQVEKINKLAFTMAHNRYYSTLDSQKKLSLVSFSLDSSGNILYQIDKNKQRPSSKIENANKFIRYKSQIRDPKRKVDNDEAIIVDFSKIPEPVQAIFIFLKVPNLVALAPQQADNLAHVQVGVEDWKQNIAIDNFQLSDVAKLEELVKPQDENTEEQTAYVFGYVLNKKGNNWIIEQIKQAKSFYELPKQPKEQNQENKEEEEEKQQQNQKSEFEEYIDSIRLFWGQQDGVLKPAKTHNQSNQEEGGSQQNLEENQQESIPNDSLVGPQIQPHVTSEFTLDLNLQFEQIQEILEQQIEKIDPEFISICTNGFDFFFHDKPLERLGQIKRIKNVQDLEVRARPPPPPEPEENEENEDGEGEDEEGVDQEEEN